MCEESDDEQWVGKRVWMALGSLFATASSVLPKEMTLAEDMNDLQVQISETQVLDLMPKYAAAAFNSMLLRAAFCCCVLQCGAL